MVYKVEGEDEGHSPPVYLHEQGSKVGGYGLSPAPHMDKRLRGDCLRRLEIVSPYNISWNILSFYNQI